MAKTLTVAFKCRGGKKNVKLRAVKDTWHVKLNKRLKLRVRRAWGISSLTNLMEAALLILDENGEQIASVYGYGKDSQSAVNQAHREFARFKRWHAKLSKAYKDASL